MAAIPEAVRAALEEVQESIVELAENMDGIETANEVSLEELNDKIDNLRTELLGEVNNMGREVNLLGQVVSMLSSGGSLGKGSGSKKELLNVKGALPEKFVG